MAEPQIVALKVTAADWSQIDTMDGPPFPGGEIDDVAFALTWQATPYDAWVGATAGKSTSPTDTPANTHIPAGLTPLSFQVALFDGLDPAASSQGGSSSLGGVDIANTGGLDSLALKAWDGALIELRRGTLASNLSTWTSVASLVAAGLTYDDRKIEIKLRDPGWQLTAPLHDEVYDGLGGIGGHAGLLGLAKPYCVGGTVTNISAILVVTSLLIYQVSFSSVYAISDVRDGGVSRTFDGDDADYATLAAAFIAGGHYRTCKALGLFRLGGQPTKAVTADVQGDNDTIDGIARPLTRAAIARRVVCGRGKTRLTAAQLDLSTFTAMDTAQPATCGYFWTGGGATAITKAEALKEVLKGCLGFSWFTLAGLLSVDYLDELPTTAAVTLSIPKQGETMGDWAVIGAPQMLTYGTPRQKTVLGYAKNYTVQKQTDLDGAVTGANVAIYGAETQQCTASNTALAAAQPTAPIVTLDTGIVLKADCQTETDRQQRVMGKRRELWTLDAKADPYSALIARAINVAGWTRHRFTGGRIFKCTRLAANERGVCTISLWG